MPQMPPETLIARHVERLLSRFESEGVQKVLQQCDLDLRGGIVFGDVTDESCYRYKQAVKEQFGDAAYSFAKVNFVLGGCKCRDCASR